MFGVLAEDATDVDTLKVLVRRIRPGTPGQATLVKGFSGKGCADLRAKAEARSKELVRDGCTRLILVHDLDLNANNQQLNDEGKLRAALNTIPSPADATRLICIPIEEIEAWFFSDPKVLGRYDSANKAVASPHLIRKPKETLTSLSRGKNKKPRYSTNENPALAAALDLDLCAKRCRAFSELRAFVLVP